MKKLINSPEEIEMSIFLLKCAISDLERYGIGKVYLCRMKTELELFSALFEEIVERDKICL